MSKARPGGKNANPLNEIDTIVHEPARLNIMARLCVVESADFLFLMRQTGLTFGNLSSHLSKLEAAGYVSVKKEFLGKKPHTMLRLTEKGRLAFRKYVQSMKQLLEEVI
jgi:DNA-binding transcriptional ArsR family regulator